MSTRRARALFVLALLTLFTSGCRALDREPEAPEWVFAFLVTGPGAAGKSDAERQTIQAGHMANIRRFVKERKLVVAGPFGTEKPDASLRGIFLFDTHDIDLAREWTSTDPAVQAGVLSMELAPFRCSAPLRRALDIHAAEVAEAEQAGRKLELEDTVRPYVMLFAHDATAAREGLAGARAERKVLFEGRLAGSARAEWIAILDAADIAAAEALLGPARAKMGRHELASWWSDKNLAGIVK